jgi:hypothetical protein
MGQRARHGGGEVSRKYHKRAGAETALEQYRKHLPSDCLVVRYKDGKPVDRHTIPAENLRRTKYV